MTARSIPGISVYLAGEGTLWKEELIRAGRLPWGHSRSSSVEQADAIFLWLWQAEPEVRVGYELGLAVALAKPTFVGTCSAEALLSFTESLGPFGAEFTGHVRGWHTGESVRDAYEHVLADADVHLPETFELRAADFDGSCVGCGARFYVGDSVRRARYRGVYHADCYVRILDPSAANSALFNAGLVEAVRKENAELTQRIQDLTL